MVPVNAIEEEQEIKDDEIDLNIQKGAYITDVESTNDNDDMFQHDSF